MTTEILRNSLYKVDNYLCEYDIENINCVIFDEVHYISDPDRGTVWEETLIMLNKEIQLIMLSATIDNILEFANWILKIKNKSIHLITTLRRIIPLEHYIYTDDKLYSIMDQDKYNILNYKIVQSKYKRDNLSIMNDFIHYLKRNNMFQTIIFSFSRSQCEKLSKMIEYSLVDYKEHQEIKTIFNKYMLKYKHQYESLNQYQTLYSLICKGIAFHHSGVLPILKEIIEIIFKQGLIKILFATETFAVGVNMPTRTVVFTGLEKHTKDGYRFLTTTEYIQMSGRAGRRGKDVKGNVIILPLYNLVDEHNLKKVLTGDKQKIKSKFIYDYSFQLKILVSTNIIDIDNFLNNSLFNIEYEKITSCLKYKLDETNESIKIYEDNQEFKENIKIFKLYDKLENEKKELEKSFGCKVNLPKKIIKEQIKLKNDISKIPMFNEKYDEYCKYIDYIKDNENIKLNLSNNNIASSSIQLINILTELNYIKDNCVTVKGIIASHINECNPIILTELIVENKLDELEPIDIISIISIFISDGENDNKDMDECHKVISGQPYYVKQIYQWINNKISDIQNLENKYYIHNDEYWKINYDYVGPANAWCNNLSMNEISKIYNIYEGTFVRNMLKLNNIIMNIQNLCKIHGSNYMLPILDESIKLIMRGIVNTGSLYI